MYEAFYGLAERPFDLTPNPRFLYVTPRQKEALANLRFGLTTPRGLTLLLGEAGSGKTTLLQAMLAEIAATSHQTVLISNPTLTRNEFYQHLAQSFQLSASAAESKTHFLFELRRELVERAKVGRCTSVVLDEAQSAPYHLLEEIRLLGNLETPTTKLLNVVLSGQPELAERLNEPSLRQLKQRVSLRCELGPFDLRNTASYIAGRLRIAGGNAAEVFTQKAVIEIYEFARGLPRTINVIADNALIGGFAAQVKPVTSEIVREVCADFDIRQQAESGGNGNGGQPTVPIAAEVALSRAAAEPSLRSAQADGSAPHFGAFTRKRRFDFFS
jgi:type II secretory pathway predicted ATPase ExeA